MQILRVPDVYKRQEIDKAYNTFKKYANEIPLDKPSNPLRVGVIGEYFTAVDAFSNLNLEQKLADMGVEMHRYMSITNRNFRYKAKNLAVETADYCKYEMGPTSTANIWCAKDYASKGFDGLVHIKSAGCTQMCIRDRLKSLKVMSAEIFLT